MITAMFEAWYCSIDERVVVIALLACAGMTAGTFLLAIINPEFVLPALLIFAVAMQWYEFDKSIRRPAFVYRLEA